MADANAVQIPTNTRDIIRQLANEPVAFARDMEKPQGDLAASTKKIEDMRAAQAAARAPVVDKIKAKSEEALPEYNPQAMPEFKPPQIDPQEMNDTVMMLTTLAAMGGLLTRQPLTAALTAFTGGVQGVVQGNQEMYKRSQDQFKANFEKAKAENDNAYRKITEARAKHGTELQGLMNELQVITAEQQDALGSEMLRRGDITSYVNMVQKKHDLFEKSATTIGSMLKADQTSAETHRHNTTMEGIASKNADTRAAAVDKKGTGEGIKIEKSLRTEYDKLAKPLTDYDRTIQKVRAAILSNSPLGDIEARQMLSELSKGARGTNMQMKITQNFGDLGERIGGFFSNVLAGRGTPEQRKQILGVLDALDQTVVSPERSALRDRYTYLAKEAGVDPLHVVIGEGGAAPAAGNTAFDPNSFLDQFTKPK